MRITICGSAKFEDQWHEIEKNLTLKGHVVYSMAVFPSWGGKKTWYTEDQKYLLDQVHCKKIDNSDCIVVVNVQGYIGESTAYEIQHARNTHKSVYYLEYPPSGELLMDEIPSAVGEFDERKLHP